jgi:hypothetical protein
MRKILAFGMAIALLALPGLAVAQTWGTVANISETMGVVGGRVCLGEASRQDIGCPTYAPSVTTSGQFIATSIATGGLTVTGATSISTISATIGDFTALRVGGVPVGSGGAAADRISSSNSQAMALATDGGTISFTLGGTAGRAYLDTTLGLVAPAVSTTGNGNFMNVNLPTVAGNANGQLRFNSTRFAHAYQAVATDGNNTFLGLLSGNTTMASGGSGFHASYNTGVGNQALNNITTGYNNTAAGYGALFSTTTGYANAAFGTNALFNTSGLQNTGVGSGALQTNSSGNNNTAVGSSAGFFNTTGTQNTSIGASAGADISSSNNNTVIGFNTGRGIVTGDANTILGANVTGLPAALSNTIILADGDGNRRINVNASGWVGINTVAPTARLTVAGDTNISGTLRATNLIADTGGLTVTGATNITTISATIGDFTTLRVGGLAVGTGGGAADRISSTNNQALAVAMPGGTISFTLAGTAGRAYLDSTLGLVAPGVSTTGPVSASSLYVTGLVDISGSASVRAFNNGAGTTFDWSYSNAQYTSATCTAFTFSNMVDGGVYTLAVQNTTAATCTFSHTGLTFRGISGYGTTTAGGHTVFVFQRLGTVVYATAVRGMV